ncbi:calcium/calmodulin-dependent protein kinase type 1D-like [Penaeus monodon]|uniref:calcium/calmodulin-dependent protein kinase type 1D-like n=1 Tax=Penaeus monodon TaxID=6687 RepID=UPI0018A74872|nr:calcium/calmodulin-dependent protein kinase type 1D-like [Penaeus monodon]XP_037800318.1 calcium/calmodulin-dependent protein kinase type 1D-like [Penaeus monodon]
MESVLTELTAHQVPVWTKAYCLELTRAWRTTFLGLGAFGVTNLVSNGLEKLVMKQMERTEERSFEREIEAVVLEGEDYVIVSRYAGVTLERCVEQKLLSSEQLEDVLEQISAALERLHAIGVTHLDLNQDNVCVVVGERRAQASIIDFGLARCEGERCFA